MYGHLRELLDVGAVTSTAPTVGSGATGTLATLNRPDGLAQVTYTGKPLYTFAETAGPVAQGRSGCLCTYTH